MASGTPPKKLALLPNTTAAHVALGESRHAVIDVLGKLGYKKVDRESPIRLLRAYWGPLWPGDASLLSQEMVEESAAFLQRVAMEGFARLGPPPESNLMEYRVAEGPD